MAGMQADESASEIQAKEAAVQKVAKLLPLPDSLASLKKIREDYASRLQVEHTKAGIEAISQAKVTVKQLRETFLLIDNLCGECRTLIENHDQINLLSHARNNLNKTYTDVQGMMSISTLASNARESLKDEKELVQTFEALTALEQKRRFAMAAVSTRMEEASRLSVVEMQEIADDQQDEEEAAAENIEPLITSPNAADGDSSVPRERKESLIKRSLSLPIALGGRRGGIISAESPITRRGYKDRCYMEIQKAIGDRFTNLLEMSVAGDFTAALEQASVVARELSANFDYVAPCFPPRYQIFQVIVQSYTERFVQMLRKLSDRANDLSNQEILKVTEWVLQYQEQLLSLGVEEMLASVCAESGAMDPLFSTYILRMKSAMQRMCSNILDVDRVNPPKRTESGRLWTPSCVDLFRLLNEQVKVVKENSTDIMLWHVAVAINQLLLEFQGAEKWRLQSEHALDIGLEPLCAMVSFDDASQGFLAVAKLAVQHGVRVIFEDPGVKELLAKLYQKGTWKRSISRNMWSFVLRRQL